MGVSFLWLSKFSIVFLAFYGVIAFYGYTSFCYRLPCLRWLFQPSMNPPVSYCVYCYDHYCFKGRSLFPPSVLVSCGFLCLRWLSQLSKALGFLYFCLVSLFPVALTVFYGLLGRNGFINVIWRSLPSMALTVFYGSPTVLCLSQFSTASLSL